MPGLGADENRKIDVLWNCCRKFLSVRYPQITFQQSGRHFTHENENQSGEEYARGRLCVAVSEDSGDNQCRRKWNQNSANDSNDQPQQMHQVM